MTSSGRSVCADCHQEGDRHQCLHCGETYESVSLLVEHQKARQHFGGHYVYSRPQRVRRVPDRFLPAEIEEANDNECGALSLANSNGDCSDDDVEGPEAPDPLPDDPSALPDLPTTTLPNSRTRRFAGADNVSDVAPSPGHIYSQPPWVKNFLNDGFKGFRFNNNFTRFWCACGKSPREGSLTYNARSNMVKHRKRKICTYDRSQGAIGEQSAKKIDQDQFRKLVVSAIVESSLPFSVVTSPSFCNLITAGGGREHLKVPSRFTVSRDVHVEFDLVKNALIEQLSTPSVPN